jgi:hypothetical protein
MKLNATYQKKSFFCRPDWRWERVMSMMRWSNPGRCTRHDDEFIRAARKFQLRWQHIESEADRERLFWDMPDLYYAHEFHERYSSEPEGALFIEARLLARQSFEHIAEVMKTTPGAIRWYEALFFNVVEHLNARDWITKQVLLPAFDRHYAPAPVSHDGVVMPRDSTVAHPFLDASLKLFAYFGGPHLVDFFIHALPVGKPLTSPDDMANWLDATWAAIIRRRSVQAALQFEVNKYNAMELFQIHARIIEFERSEESREQQRTVTERHIQAMIDEIPWAFGDEGDKVYRDTEVGRFDRMAAELRDDELLQVAAGGQAPDLGKDWPDKLPAPSRKSGAAARKEAPLP